MRISYVTINDSSSLRSWSGIDYYIKKTLQEFAEVQVIDNLKSTYDFSTKAKKLLYKVKGKEYLRNRDLRVIKDYTEQIAGRIDQKTEFVFCPSTIPIAFLNTNVPKVIYTDATFQSMLGYYPAFNRLCKSSIESGNYIEKQSLDSCSLAIFSSGWAAKSAINDYNIPSSKVKVIPFGANISCDRTENHIAQYVEAKSRTKINLLFLAVEWERKGGELAVEITRLINKKGVEAELHVAGITNHKKFPEFVKSYGYVDKSSETGKSLIHDLFTKSHFLLLPSKADCTPIVLSEASSYGLPSVTIKTGGIESIIRDNINGMSFTADTKASEYADYIIDTFSNFSSYETISKSSFDEYKERLNWKSSGKAIFDSLIQL